VHLEELVGALRRKGHEVELAGPRHVEHERFGADAGIVDWMKRWSPLAIYELMELAYALVDYARLAKAIRRFRPDVIYERYNLFLPSGVWASRRFGLPLILEVNAPLFYERARHSGGLALRRLARWSERYAWCNADHVLPVTNVLADIVREAGVPGDRITVIHNGIDEASYASLPGREAAKKAAGLDGRLVLGFVGFMREWHGLDRVVTFLARNKDLPLHAVFVGDGPVRVGLEQLAAARNVSDRMTITGVIERNRVPHMLASFDVALQPAVVEYASPLKLFEYLAAGLPVIAPDSENIREVLEHDRNALLFSSVDDASFGLALDKICRDASLRERLSKAARQTILERGLTWDRNADRVVETTLPLIASLSR
jgi:glycosyltransferase involved in cell wall biosynthesis